MIEKDEVYFILDNTNFVDMGDENETCKILEHTGGIAAPPK